MKVLVVSDTHRKKDNYLKALRIHAPLDMVIHCGDAEGEGYALTAAAQCPVYIVLGNNDVMGNGIAMGNNSVTMRNNSVTGSDTYPRPLAKELELTLEKYRVWVTHGHHYNVYMGNGMLKQEAKGRGADIVMYGHTHCPVIDRSTQGIIAVNPGSLTYPRQEGHRPSYIIMEIDRHGEAHFTVAYL